eukprot:scaffold778_cov263-Pinguiococcus_pyrenoidosus.AAC.10
MLGRDRRFSTSNSTRPTCDAIPQLLKISRTLLYLVSRAPRIDHLSSWPCLTVGMGGLLGRSESAKPSELRRYADRVVLRGVRCAAVFAKRLSVQPGAAGVSVVGCEPGHAACADRLGLLPLEARAAGAGHGETGADVSAAEPCSKGEPRALQLR